MKKLIVFLLLMGCATAPAYQERFTEPWIAVAEIKLSDWEALAPEQKAEVVMIIMTTYLKRVECYKATLNIILVDDKLVFTIKCTQRISEVNNERIKGIVGEITQRSAG